MTLKEKLISIREIRISKRRKPKEYFNAIKMISDQIKKHKSKY